MVCGGQQMQVQGNSVQVDVADTVIACTFTNTVTRAAILGLKIVTGDTSTWTRPAQFHITCPELELDIDIEPPVGPGGPGTYTIGQGSIPPATCTISEIDTGSDSNVQVSMVIANHGVPIASGATAVTFTSHAGDDLVFTVRNTFLVLARPSCPNRHRRRRRSPGAARRPRRSHRPPRPSSSSRRSRSSRLRRSRRSRQRRPRPRQLRHCRRPARRRACCSSALSSRCSPASRSSARTRRFVD